MNNKKLETYLSKLNITPNKAYRLPQLNYIILESDANQYYNHLMQEIIFDTTNNLIRINYSPLELVSGVVKPFTYSDTNKTLYFSNGPTTIYVNKKIREPKAGDIFSAYANGDDFPVSSLIENVINTYNGTRIVLHDNNIINKIKTATKPMRFFIQFNNIKHRVTFSEPSEIYKEHVHSDAYSDIYISIDKVIGFDYDKKWRPNNS